MKCLVLLSAVVLLAGSAYATEFKQCKSATRQLSDDSVGVSGCTTGTCKLRKRSTVEVEIKFTPETEVSSLRTSVQAEVFGVPLPFVGVDGQSACGNLFEEDGTTPAGCPLEPSKTYVYKNKFKILDLYPRLSVVVHWALLDGHGKDVACFEVDAKIVNSAKPSA